MPEELTWVDIGMLFAQGLAVLVAAFGLFFIWKQISQADKHHQEALAGSVRPVVTLSSTRIIKSSNGVYVEVEASNVGVGPALDVVLTGWLRHLPQEGLPGWESRPLIDRAKTEVDLDHPEFRLRIGSLAVGAVTREFMAVEPTGLTASPKIEGAFLVYCAEFRDVGDRAYPRSEIERKPGHVLFRNVSQ